GQSTPVEVAGGGGIGDGQPARPVPAGLFAKGFGVGVGAEADGLETVVEVVDDFEAVGADRPGGAEHDDAPAGTTSLIEVCDERHAPPYTMWVGNSPRPDRGILVGVANRPQVVF